MDIFIIFRLLILLLQFSEQSGAYEAMFPAPKSDDVAGAGESLCADKATNVPGSSTFSTSTLHNTSDFADETKNFRRVTSFDTEVPRDFDPTGWYFFKTGFLKKIKLTFCRIIIENVAGNNCFI